MAGSRTHPIASRPILVSQRIYAVPGWQRSSLSLETAAFLGEKRSNDATSLLRVPVRFVRKEGRKDTSVGSGRW